MYAQFLLYYGGLVVSVVTVVLFLELGDVFQLSAVCTISLPVPYCLYILRIPRYRISCAYVINGIRQDLK
jgi:hypothetical protein